jgi:hypothetical protein
LQPLITKHESHGAAFPQRSLLFLLQRITACASAGYSAVVADFISDYGQTPGNSLGLTTSDYAAYLTWLSDTVTAAGMGFGAMDGPDVLNVPGVLDKLGFAVATGCASKSTCPMFAAIPAGRCLQGLTQSILSMQSSRMCDTCDMYETHSQHVPACPVWVVIAPPTQLCTHITCTLPHRCSAPLCPTIRHSDSIFP